MGPLDALGKKENFRLVLAGDSGRILRDFLSE